MTSANRKRDVRDIRDRTAWPYAFALQLVRRFGYESVSASIDRLGDNPTPEEIARLRHWFKIWARNPTLAGDSIPDRVDREVRKTDLPMVPFGPVPSVCNYE